VECTSCGVSDRRESQSACRPCTTVSQPSSISSLNIVFIIGLEGGWGVREAEKHDRWFGIVPSLVMKAAFHSSPALIRTLSVSPANVEFGKRALFPLTRLISLGMRGSGSGYGWSIH